MSTTYAVSPTTQATIDAALTNLEMCKGRFLFTFSFIPDDKLGYTPGGKAKTPLRIAAHVACSNSVFAMIIRGETPPVRSEQDVDAMMEQKETAITTRQQAIDTLENSTAEVIAAIKSLTDETVNRIVETPIITAPMGFWMNLPARHLDGHASQLDYIQTTWGDTEWHFGN